MRGITFGYLVLFTILLSLVLAPVAMMSPGVSMTLYGLGSLALLLYWIYGMIITNPEGYLGCPSIRG